MPRKPPPPPSQANSAPVEVRSPHKLAVELGDVARFKLIANSELVWQSHAGMQTNIFFWSNRSGPPINGRQNRAYTCTEILCGGPRGPGKSAALIAWMAEPVGNPNYVGLILRKTTTEMDELIAECWKLYEKLGAVKRGNPTSFHFPSGAIVYTGHLKDMDDFEQIRGNQYHRIGVDEVQNCIADEALYASLLSVNRTADATLPAQMLLTANPDGPGNHWLKARFINVIGPNGEYIPPDTPFVEPVTKRVRIYLPGTLAENPTMMENDPFYLNTLMDPAHPEHRRRAWIYGDWDAVTGSFYPDFRARKISSEPPEAMHVVPSYDLPDWCHIWGSLDWGFGHHAAAYWYRIGPDRRIHVIREYVVRGASATELGAEIARRSLDYLSRMEEPMIRFYISPDAFSVRDRNHMIADQISMGVQTILGPGSSALLEFSPEEFELSKSDMTSALEQRTRRLASMEIDGRSIWFTRANNSRVAGWSFLRDLFRWRSINQVVEANMSHARMLLKLRGQVAYNAYLDRFMVQKEEILPMVQIHDCNRVLIETIPRLYCSDKNPDDVKKFDSTERSVGDDPADSLRMGAMAYNDHEHKVPQRVWISNEVARIAREQGATDINVRIQIAQQATKRYNKEFAEPDTTPVREAMLLRRGQPTT